MLEMNAIVKPQAIQENTAPLQHLLKEYTGWIFYFSSNCSVYFFPFHQNRASSIYFSPLSKPQRLVSGCLGHVLT